MLAELFRNGRHADLERLARHLVQKYPDAGIPNFFLGMAQAHQGKLDDAAASYRRTIDIDPDFAEAHNGLGDALIARGDHEEAAARYVETLKLQPDHLQARCNLGVALRKLGRLDDAASCYRRALTNQPANAEIHFNLGNVLKDLGKFEEAVDSYHQALSINANVPGLHANLSGALILLDRYHEAVESSRRALRDDPDDVAALASFAAAFRSAGGVMEGDDVTDHVVRCLESPNIDAQTVATGSAVILKRKLAAVAQGPSSENELPDLDGKTSGLLVAHLKNALITDASLERFLTFVRRCLLDEVVREGAANDGASLSLCEALACQGFLNEYVWHVTDEEDRRVDQLQAAIVEAINSGLEPATRDLYVLAAYRALFAIEEVRRWGLDFHARAKAGLKQMLERFVVEPQAELLIAEKIETLTPIDDEVSRAVRSQYEENPYPRWDSLTIERAYPYNIYILREIAPNQPELDRATDHPRVLIAGCGTGKHPIDSALRYLNSSVLAVDLSRASLAYGLRKARELKVDNVRFAQGDILKLGDLNEQFDIIESSGVLHHMAEPEAGLKVLLPLLRPGGYLRLGLYSECARRNVVALRQRIADTGIEATPTAIRRFRYNLEHEDPDLFERILWSRDFFSMSNLRDLLFHVQEHRFTIPQIKTLLDDNGLEFLGFVFSNKTPKKRYSEEYPDDRACIDLENWHHHEEEHPGLFSGMYQFWCRKAV